MMEEYTWCRVRCVTGVCRLVMATSRDLCVEKRDGRRATRGLARKHAGENCRVRLIGRNEMIAASMYSPKFVNEALRVLGKQLIDDGRLESVSLYLAGPTADFPELDT